MSEQPDAGEVTLGTIRNWVERNLQMTEGSDPQSRSGGIRYAARSLKAILDVHGKPPWTPVEMPGADET